MDKNLFNKSSNFFKKEGFYVILFVCLCIVATVAVLTSRNNKLKTEPPVAVQPKAGGTPNNITDASKNEEPTNALEVNKNTKTGISVAKNGSASAQVSKTVSTKFIKPISGKVVNPYSETPVYSKSLSTDNITSYRSNLGIDIVPDKDSNVYAVLDGTVESVGEDLTDGYGIQVVIYHPVNGLRTYYSNLDKNVTVKVGDKVTQGTKIGKIGGTTVSAAFEDYGKNFLHFAVRTSKSKNNSVDPAKYIKY